MQRILGFCCCVLFTVFTMSARAADTSDDRASGSPARVPEAVQGVISMIAPTTPALLSAGVTTKSDSTQFRATFVPMRAFDLPYIEVLSETKLSLLTDTSTNLARPALTFSFNPFSLRGYRGPGRNAKPITDGEQIKCSELPPSPPSEEECGKREVWLRCKLRAIQSAGAAIQQRRRDVVALEASLGDATEALFVAQDRVVPADADEKDREELEGARSAALERYRAARGKYLAAKAAVEVEEAELKKQEKASAADLADAVKGTDDCETRRLAARWPKLNGTFIPMISVTGFVELYPTGRVPDPKDSTGKTNASLESWGGHGFEGSFSFHFTERLGLDLYGSYKRVRSSGSPHTELADYVGGGITLSSLVVPFIAADALPSSPDYVKEGFIPGISIGASAQVVHCDGREECAKQRSDQRSITPFVDIRVKPQMQIRLSLPIATYSSVAKDGTDIAPTLSIAAQIGGL